MAATTTTTTTDVAQALAGMLEGIEGLRVSAYVADNFRPPGVIIALPDIDYGPDGGYCFATWTFPLSVIVARTADRAAQESLSRWVSEIARALSVEPPPDGLFSVEPTSARPSTTNVAGTDLPSYQLRVVCRA